MKLDEDDQWLVWRSGRRFHRLRTRRHIGLGPRGERSENPSITKNVERAVVREYTERLARQLGCAEVPIYVSAADQMLSAGVAPLELFHLNLAHCSRASNRSYTQGGSHES